MCFMFPWTYVLRGFFVKGVALLHGNKQIHGKTRVFVYLFRKMGENDPPIKYRVLMDGSNRVTVSLKRKHSP